MAAILTNCELLSGSALLSILIVSAGDIVDKVFEGLKAAVDRRDYRVYLHRAESITDVLRFKPNLNVDYVVFAFDGRLQKFWNEVENDLQSIDNFYVISGRICLVNCYDSAGNMGMISHYVNKLCEKYSLPSLSVNIQDKESTKDLGSQILNLSETLLGIPNTYCPNLSILTTV